MSDLSQIKTITGEYSGFADNTLRAMSADFMQTTAMTAYQLVGDYYSASNPSGFITSVPDTYLQNTDLATSDGKVTAISGIPLSAGGGAFPQSASEAVEYVTATSGDINSTIDNVSANSGVWGGSALPISAGPGIKFEMVDDTLVASTDETVLLSSSVLGTNSTGTLSEDFHNFEYVQLFGTTDDGSSYPMATSRTRVTTATTNYVSFFTCNNGYSKFFLTSLSGTQIKLEAVKCVSWNGSWSTPGGTWTVDKIVGINRIAGGN